MRWAELVVHCRDNDLILPTYRQMDGWSTRGFLKFETRAGHPGGQFRWWPPEEVEVACNVARLVDIGFDVELAFQIARVEPSGGSRAVAFDDGPLPHVVVSVEWLSPTT